MAKKTSKSKTSPVGGKRGCLCKDGTYSVECCNGDTIAQGIGKLNSDENLSISEVDGVKTIIATRG